MLKYKWLCLAMAFCAIFIACEKQATADLNPIAFNNGPARAAQVQASAANARVWGYYTSNDETKWVYGTETTGEYATLTINTNTDGSITGTGDLVINGNTKYWTVGIYDFFSIYSEKFISTTTEPTFSNGTLSFSYDISDQKELRYACHLNTTGSATRPEKVYFNYQHLLSRVKFQGFSKVSGKPIVVKSVSVADVPSKATVSMNIGGESTTDAKSLTATYFVTSDKFDISNSSTEGMICNSTDGYVVLDKMVFPSDKALKDLTFTIAYDVDDVVQEPQTATLKGYEFEAGKSYLIKFYIQPSGPIIFGNTVTVEEWSNNPDEFELGFDITP